LAAPGWVTAQELIRRASAYTESALRSFSLGVLSFFTKRPFSSWSMATKPRVERSPLRHGIR
jgi:hypothetical protein